MKHLHTALLALVTLQLACQSADASSVPARMSEGRASTACIAQMQDFITLQQGLRTVLTHAAFADSNFLSIVTTPLLDDNGRLAQGRERSLPTVYELSKSTAGCTITRGGTSNSLLLTSCSCTPLA